jgi:hypothetical protein
MGSRIMRRFLHTAAGSGLLLACLFLVVGCSDALLEAVYNSIASLTAPAVSPGDKMIITGHESITLVFNESMSPSSLTMEGTLGTPDTVSWSQSSFQNDTVTLSISSNWNSGVDRSLTVNCRSVAGTAIAPFTVTYTVFHGVCVSTSTGSDTDTGTTLEPLKQIATGIAEVQSRYSTGEVHVAEGAYSGPSPLVTMVDGISVYGGYNPKDWSDRNTTSFVTTITDTSSSSGSDSSPNRAVFFPSTVGNGTVLDGCTIRSGSGSWSAAIYCEGSPIIQNNRILGPDSAASGGDNQVGISIRTSSSSATVRNNFIDAGFAKAGDFYQAFGVYIGIDASPTIQNNSMIDGGEAYWTYAVYTIGADSSPYPQIEGNTIDAGGGTNANYCIYVQSSRPAIDGNTLDPHKSASNTYGIYEAFPSNCDPDAVTNNNFDFNWGYWYRDGAGAPLIEYDNWNTATVSTATENRYLLASEWGNYSAYADPQP